MLKEQNSHKWKCIFVQGRGDVLMMSSRVSTVSSILRIVPLVFQPVGLGPAKTVLGAFFPGSQQAAWNKPGSHPGASQCRQDTSILSSPPVTVVWPTLGDLHQPSLRQLLRKPGASLSTQAHLLCTAEATSWVWVWEHPHLSFVGKNMICKLCTEP